MDDVADLYAAGAAGREGAEENVDYGAEESYRPRQQDEDQKPTQTPKPATVCHRDSVKLWL